MFLSPNILTKTHRKLPPDENRKFDIELTYEYTDIDTVEIKLPAGYEPEAIPQDIKLESRYGNYSSSVKVLHDRIIYFRSLEQFSGRFPAKEYNDLVKFYEQIYKADRSQVVLVKTK